MVRQKTLPIVDKNTTDPQGNKLLPQDQNTTAMAPRSAKGRQEEEEISKLRINKTLRRKKIAETQRQADQGERARSTFIYSLSGEKLCEVPGGRLSGADLSGKNLDHADLHGRDLRCTNLSHASLRMANLNGADLRDAELFHTYLDGTQLVGTRLANANLENATVRDMDLSNNNFRDARLREIEFTQCQMAGVKLTHCDLTDAKFVDSEMQKADLSGSVMKGCFLCRVDLRGASLADTDLSEGGLPTELNNVDLRGADLTGANLTGVSIKQVTLDGSTKLDGAWPADITAQLEKLRLKDSSSTDADPVGKPKMAAPVPLAPLPSVESPKLPKSKKGKPAKKTLQVQIEECGTPGAVWTKYYPEVARQTVYNWMDKYEIKWIEPKEAVKDRRHKKIS